MTCHCAVTYEFETRPPETWRGTAKGWGEHTVMQRAMALAKRALRPVAWSSVACVILDRTGEPAEIPGREGGAGV